MWHYSRTIIGQMNPVIFWDIANAVLWSKIIATTSFICFLFWGNFDLGLNFFLGHNVYTLPLLLMWQITLSGLITYERNSARLLPLPTAFAVAVEPYSLAPKSSPLFTGIIRAGQEHWSLLYADDLLLYVTDLIVWNSFPNTDNVWVILELYVKQQVTSKCFPYKSPIKKNFNCFWQLPSDAFAPQETQNDLNLYMNLYHLLV